MLGGDYVSFGDRSYMAPVAERLGALVAPHGVFGIIGNHDDERVMPAELRRRGVAMLMDDRTTLEIRGERLDLAGVKFWTKTMDDIVPVLSGATVTGPAARARPPAHRRGRGARGRRRAGRPHARRPGGVAGAGRRGGSQVSQ